MTTQRNSLIRRSLKRCYEDTKMVSSQQGDKRRGQSEDDVVSLLLPSTQIANEDDVEVLSDDGCLIVASGVEFSEGALGFEGSRAILRAIDGIIPNNMQGTFVFAGLFYPIVL